MAKNYLISGANSGIGRALAEDLAQRGHRVFATAPTESECESLEGISERVIPLLLDLRSADHIERVKAAVLEHTSQLDGLINNAGVGLFGPVELLEMASIRNSFEINVFGHIQMTQAFLPLLREAEGARIVFTGSVAGLMAQPIGGCYASTKSAIHAFCDSLRMELKPQNIHVSVLQPGRIQTPIWSTTQYDAYDDHPGIAPYQEALVSAQKLMKVNERAAVPVERVTRAMRHALFSKRPKAKYLVGADARFVGWLRLLPASILDWILMRL